MFSIIEDFKGTSESEEIFPSPFSHPVLCKPLENWKKSPQCQQIEQNWGKQVANRVLRDYQNVVREWMKETHPKLRLSNPSAFEVNVDDFLPSDGKLDELRLAVSQHEEPSEEKVEDQSLSERSPESLTPKTKTLVAAKDELLKCEIATKLSKSLAYFLHYVISKPILERVRRVAILKKLQESKPSTWRELSTAVLWELREESALKRLALSLSQTRKEPLHDWLSICVVARAEFIKADVSLPEREWAVYATRQMSQAELAEFSEDDLSSLAKLHAAVRVLSPESLPKWSPRQVSEKLKSWQLPISNPKSAPPPPPSSTPRVGEKKLESKKPERSKPAKKPCHDFARGSCSYGERCKFAHSADTSMASLSSKTSLRRNSDRTKGRDPVCYHEGCAKSGHTSADCPRRRKGPVKTAFFVDPAVLAAVPVVGSEVKTSESDHFVVAGKKARKYHDRNCETFWGAIREDSSIVRYRASAKPRAVTQASCCAAEGIHDGVCAFDPHEAYETWPMRTIAVAQDKPNVTATAMCALKMPNGSVQDIQVALDSYAGVSLARAPVVHNVTQRATPLILRGLAGTQSVTSCGLVKLVDRRGGQHVGRVNVVPPECMPLDCTLLLSATACAKLNVDVNWHLQYLRDQGPDSPIPRIRILRPPARVLGRVREGPPVLGCVREGTPVLGRVREVSPARAKYVCGSDDSAVVALIEQFGQGDSFEEVFISEAMFRAYNERQPRVPGRREYAMEDITMPEEEPARTRCRAVIEEFSDCFAEDDGEPPALNAEPYKVRLKPGAVLPCVKKPRWPPAQEECLRRWAAAALAEGERVPDGGWERAHPNCNTASRPIAVLKTGPSGQRPELDPDFDIRVCGSYVEMNDCCEAEPTQAPDREELVRTLGLYDSFFGTDGISCYRQILLDEESRYVTALWTPLGIIQSRRLVFGMKNAGTVLGRVLTDLMNELSPTTRAAFKNFADDFRGGGHGLDDHLEKVREFLLLCRKYGVTLKPTKTFIGMAEVEFVGYLIRKGLITVSPANLRPIANLEPPRDVSALRRVLGLFVQSRGFVPQYGVLSKPLTRLTGSVKFEWGTREQSAFEVLKAAILAAPALHMPDYSKPFFGRSDASDYAVGGYVYQLADSGEECVILYVSAPYQPSMVAKPTFYKEAWGVVFVISAARVYITNSPFTYTHGTDHAPLRWMKQCLKGPVSAWIAEKIGDLEFKLVYVKGPENIVADALSRFPFVKYGTSTFLGLMNMFSALLKVLGSPVKSSKRVWVWASRDTIEAARLVQSWRNPSNALITKAPKSAGSAWDHALLAPPPDTASLLCADLFATGKPFACLVPSDLVNWIAVGRSRVADSALQAKVDSAAKISFLDSGMTWLVEGCSVPHDVVMAAEVLESENVRQRWASALADSKARLQAKHGESLVVRSDGLLMIARPGRPAVVLVPESERLPLIRTAHESTGHAAEKRTLIMLRQTYFWDGMAADVKRFISRCECVASKAKIKLAHGVWRAVTYNGPGDALGLDFYAVAKSEGGFTVVVAMVDLFSRWRKFVALLNRQAAEAVRAILEWIYQRGCPAVLVSDADPAILGSVVQGLLKALGIKHMRTQYHPEGNSIVERGFVLLGEFLRRMPVENRLRWPSDLSKLGFAANACHNASIGMSPFEADCGRVARQPFDSQFVEPASIELDERKCVGLYGRLGAVTALYRQVASDVSKASSAATADRLNARGNGPVDWKLGDRVIVYVPPARSSRAMAVATDGSRLLPSNDEGKETMWKVKHTVQWRGPCVVIEKPSPSMYRVKELSSGKTFERHVSLIYRAQQPSSPQQSTPESPASGPLDSAPAASQDGDVVAVLDEPGEKTIWLMKCVSSDNDELKGHLFAASSTTVASARFRLVHIERKTGLSILGLPKAYERADPWIGTVPDNEDYVVARQLRFRANGALTADSARRLRGFRANMLA